MPAKHAQVENELFLINRSFYDLIVLLRANRFDFCAFVVEDAYRFYMLEFEKRVHQKKFN
ncbi:MAG: hypothetical protein IJS26_03190 [Alphaproteobacteria bacterium]|nr:hypothetical protein [Alphaproteobacteria bacterium]